MLTTASITRSAVSATESGPLPDAARPAPAVPRSAPNPAAKANARMGRRIEMSNGADMGTSKHFVEVKKGRKTQRNKAQPQNDVHIKLFGVTISAEKRPFPIKTAYRA